MTEDPAGAHFYLVDDERGSADAKVAPLPFTQAFEHATLLSKSGAHVRVLFSETASQSELSRFANRGIPTAPIREP